MNPEQNEPQNQENITQQPQTTPTPPDQPLVPTGTNPVASGYNPIPVPQQPTITIPDNQIQQQPQFTNTTPIVSPSTMPRKSSKKRTIFVIVVVAVIAVALIVGAVVALNASPSTDKQGNTQDTEQTEEPATQSTTTTEQETTPTGQDSSVLISERDTDRKYELKNAQKNLEMYFNDNGEYPADWTTVVPDSEDRTGPSGDDYTYNVSDDLQTYTLSAKLENPNDDNADANGNYVIESVNQWQ